MGVKIDYDQQKNCMKLTQQDLTDSLEAEFQIDSGGHILQSPATSGQVLGPVNQGTVLTPEEQTMYQSEWVS